MGVVSLIILTVTKLNNTREVKDEIAYEILANEELLTFLAFYYRVGGYNRWPPATVTHADLVSFSSIHLTPAAAINERPKTTWHPISPMLTLQLSHYIYLISTIVLENEIEL